MNTESHIDLVDKVSAKNYKPLPVVLSKGQGEWVWDVEGHKYLDCLAGYSSMNHGHRHPRILDAVSDQMKSITVTSRAFHNDQMGSFLKKLVDVCEMEVALPMNTGAEAVETAIKMARKWGYEKKGVLDNQAEIIVCENNFHGRTVTIVSFSIEEDYRKGFGPFTPGFKIIPFGDAEALERAITKNTVAFMVEPIQGEAGVLIPPQGYLTKVREICTKHNVLMMLDEIQTGFGRTGKMFAYQYETNAKPDVLILGKALGGGVYPVSAVVAAKSQMDVFKPGQHGSTFGGNPLASRIAKEALDVLVDEKLPERSLKIGQVLLDKIKKEVNQNHIKEIRGRGLMIGIEVKESSGKARGFCEALQKLGILCKETHEQTIRITPPLVIEEQSVDFLMKALIQVFN